MSIIKWILTPGVLLLVFLLSFQAGVNAAHPISPRTGKALSTDNVEIVYTVQGKGDITLIFIHGGFADRSFWENQMKPFSEKYCVIAIDLAGHGESGKNRTKWDIFSFANDVLAVIEKEKIKRAVLIGNSLGGPVILETARLIPEKVAALVPVDTFYTLIINTPPDAIKNVAQAYRADYAGTIKQMVKALFHKDVDPQLYAKVEKKMLNCTGEMAASLMESFITYTSADSLKIVKCPIRCINGDLYPTQVENNRKVYSDFDAIIIPHTGHFPMLECPDLFNRHLTEILKSLSF